MDCAVVDEHACAKDLVADEGPLLARGVKAAAAGVEILFGNGSAGDLFLENVLVALAGWLNPADDAGKVAWSAGLSAEQVVELDLLGDGLPVRDLRLPCFAIDAVLAPHPLEVDV